MTGFLCIDVCVFVQCDSLIYNDQLMVILAEPLLKFPKVYKIMAIIPSNTPLFVKPSYTSLKSAYTPLKVFYPSCFTFLPLT